ncbi:MAG: lysophospholipid acyltransferase family protein [Candidatus Omnitrophica bacterium]|nr:lysophospholipid acyltransferase family protein [Candidatus Omnitrophota bacterium]
MRSLQYAAGAVSFGLLTVLARILPPSAFCAFGRFGMSLFYILAGRKLRKVSRESLSVAFGSGMAEEEKMRIAEASAKNLMSGLVGHACSAFRPGLATRIFSLDGKESLDSALQKGRGAVISVAHFGPFSWMLYKFIDLGYKVNVVMRPPRNGFLYKKFRDAKRICGLNIIYSVPVRQCVVECLQALEKGELVFMPVDQNYGGTGRVFVDFFGRKAATATGPVMFARKTGAPLFFAHALPEGSGRFRITLSPEIALEKGVSEREALIAGTAAVTKIVEDLARAYPEQWSWMHKRWKAVPRDGEV